MLPLYSHADMFRSLNFDLVYVISEGTSESAHLPGPSLVDNVLITKVSCPGLYKY